MSPPPVAAPFPDALSAVAPRIQTQLLETISSAVQAGRSPESVAQACARLVLDLTDAYRVAVYLEDEQTRELRCLAIVGHADGAFPPGWEACLEQARAEGRPVATGAVLAIPLLRAGRAAGVLAAQGSSGERAAVGGGADLLGFVASRLADGLEHSKLSQKYAQKVLRIQQLEEVSAILNSSLDDTEIVRRATEVATRMVDAEAGALLLVDDVTGDLLFEIMVGERGAQLQAHRMKAGHGIAGTVAKSGEPLVVNDAMADPRVAKEVDQRTGFHTRSILCVPVRSHHKLLAVLEAVNKRGGRPFSNWDLIEFTSLANQIAIALENTRLFRESQGRIRRLRKLQEISALLNSSLNQAEIRTRAIEAATVLMDAEAGSLLLLDEGTNELYFEVALGEKGEGVREIRLKVGQGIAGHVAQTRQPVIINDAQNDARFSRDADKRSGFVTRNMVCVPVMARDKLLGVLQAINKRHEGVFGQEDLQDFVALGHQVGIAIENANLYEEISRLFEGFITASVTAIESRDPTTSGHSERVATLTCGLAEVVDRLDNGPFAGVTFTPEQVKEIRYAAVLHDFGKVGVREHILVKANKLFPGDLALLKARFDFIKRTLELKAYKRKVEILTSGDRPATAELLAGIDETLARQIADTDGILEFLLQCNKPTVLPTGGFERLNDVAKLHFDSFDGVRPFLTPDEVVTLSIAKGSLTAEERREIESHVTHTYKFLSTIPWSKALKNVPLIAYGHHEKLDGSGYPRRVPGESIPVQTRMMTISDIYDALTASDRPYKSAVNFSTALDILRDEVKHGKVDGALLEIFIDAKVYSRTQPAS